MPPTERRRPIPPLHRWGTRITPIQLMSNDEVHRNDVVVVAVQDHIWLGENYVTDYYFTLSVRLVIPLIMKRYYTLTIIIDGDYGRTTTSTTRSYVYGK